MEQDFIRGSHRDQIRVLAITAAVVVAALGLVIAAGVTVHRQVSGQDVLDLGLRVPYVAPGVSVGTKVILRGAEVGEVTSLDKASDGGVLMALALKPDRIVGLTDSLDVDFRPQNYFGVTAVNLIGNQGGTTLAAGDLVNTMPEGDYSLSSMLTKGSEVVDGTLTQSMIDTLDKVVRYTDGLTPLVQSVVVIGHQVSRTQIAFPSELLGNMNAILDTLPAFDRNTIDGLYDIYDTKFDRLPDGSFGVDDELLDDTDVGLQLGSGKLFSAAGHLLASHPDELTPAVDAVTALSDVVPSVLASGALTSKLEAVISGYENSFTDDGGRTTLDLRLVLDGLPALAQPFGTGGVPR